MEFVKLVPRCEETRQSAKRLCWKTMAFGGTNNLCKFRNYFNLYVLRNLTYRTHQSTALTTHTHTHTHTYKHRPYPLPEYFTVHINLFMLVGTHFTALTNQQPYSTFSNKNSYQRWNRSYLEMKAVSWVHMPGSMGPYQCYRGTYSLHLQYSVTLNKEAVHSSGTSEPTCTTCCRETERKNRPSTEQQLVEHLACCINSNL